MDKRKFFLFILGLGVFLSSSVIAQDATIDGRGIQDADIIQFDGMFEPATSPLSKGRIYYDLTSDKLKCSENNGAYVNCIGGASQLSDLSDVGSSTPTAGNLLVADGSDWESVTITGDVTIGGSGVTAIDLSINPVWTGAHDFGGATSLEVPNGASPTVNAIGEIAVDTDVITQGQMVIYGASAINYVTATTDSPADNEIPKYDSGTGTITWEADAGGGSGFIMHIDPEKAKLPGSDSLGIDAGGKRWAGNFDDTTDECAEWSKYLFPFDGETFKGGLLYTAHSATTGTVALDIYIMCVSGGDSIAIDTTDSFGSVNSLTGTVPGTAGYPALLTDASLNEDSCAENDLIIVKICRDADGSDTVNGDIKLRNSLIYAE